MITKKKIKSSELVKSEIIAKGEKSSFQCRMMRLIFNVSTFSASLESVNSRGVHCFFLHLHLLIFIL